MDVMKLAKSMLKNQYVLYAVIAVSALHLMGYFSINDPECLVLFVLSALASRAFSTNMVVNLGVALLASNVLFAGKCTRHVVEGMKEGLECGEGEDEVEIDGEKQCVPAANSESESSEEEN